VRLSVTDDGIGMEPDVCARIFEPFFTTKERGKGTGLGLATVHAIVERAGGTVSVRSAPGRGTTFSIYLPASGELPSQRTPATGRPAVARGEVVLVVEDDPGVRRTASRILRRAGYAVLEAADADEALRRLDEQASPVDLLLTDVVMPGASGGALAEVVRARRPGVAVAFMSGYPDEAIGARGVREGFTLVRKPFTDAGLLRAVRALLDARGAPELEA
jgi:CheY-like chemotaxis protein